MAPLMSDANKHANLTLVETIDQDVRFWSPGLAIEDFNLLPGDIKADGLRDRFLCSPAAGHTFRRSTVIALSVCENTLQESRVLHRPRNPFDVNQIQTDPNDHSLFGRKVKKYSK